MDAFGGIYDFGSDSVGNYGADNGTAYVNGEYGSSDWSGFVDTGAKNTEAGVFGSHTEAGGLFNGSVQASIDAANGGNVSNSIFGYLRDFWDGGGDKTVAAQNKGLIGSILAGGANSYLQGKSQEKAAKTNAKAQMEILDKQIAEKKRTSAVPKMGAGGWKPATRSDFKV